MVTSGSLAVGRAKMLVRCPGFVVRQSISHADGSCLTGFYFRCHGLDQSRQYIYGVQRSQLVNMCSWSVGQKATNGQSGGRTIEFAKAISPASYANTCRCPLSRMGPASSVDILLVVVHWMKLQSLEPIPEPIEE